jgi:chromosome partitioning protein
MRTIMVMNAKGGCGKTTLATNVATWFADDGARVAIADLDPQRSSLDWLDARRDYTGIPEIHGVDGTGEALRPPKGMDFLIYDVPAATHGRTVADLLRRVETILLPVLPSPIDMRAARRFLEELLASGRVSKGRTKIGIVANRVREQTLIYQRLEEFLGHLDLPVVSHLRESQNYIRAAERGLGIFELAPSLVYQDVVLWDPVIDWLSSSASRPG